MTTGQNYTIIGTTTITANFIRENNSITVTIISNNTNYGTVSQGSVIVPYGTTYSGTINVITFNDTSGTQVNITATPATSTAKYKYDFSGWSVNSGTLGDAITAPITLTANFTQSLQYYTVTFKTNSTVSSISHQSISVLYGTTFTQVGTGLEFYYDDELLYTISVIWQNTRNYYISPSSGTIEGDLTISLGTN